MGSLTSVTLLGLTRASTYAKIAPMNTKTQKALEIVFAYRRTYKVYSGTRLVKTFKSVESAAAFVRNPVCM
jgi:hypothetical protein